VKRPVRKSLSRRVVTDKLFWFVGLPIVLLWAFYSFSTAPDRARSKLSQQGYSEVQITGWKPINLYCDSQSGIAEGFVARQNGLVKTGYVCTSPVFSFVVVD
jgi:hypothetical protein